MANQFTTFTSSTSSTSSISSISSISDGQSTISDPNRKWRMIRLVSIAILTLMVGFTARLVVIALSDGLAAGEIAPDFVGRTLQGDEIRLADNQGKATMLVFWSPDCSACRHELPAIQAIADDPARSFALITVVSYSLPTEVKAFAETNHLNFPIISDESGEISQRYDVHGIPFSYLINPNGVIDKTIVGSGGQDDLRNNLFAWLSTCDIQQACSVQE